MIVALPGLFSYLFYTDACERSMMLRLILLCICAGSEFQITKYMPISGYKQLKMSRNIYSYIIKDLLH